MTSIRPTRTPPAPGARRPRAVALAWLLAPALACAPLSESAGLTAQTGDGVAPAGTAAASPEAVLDSILTTPPLSRAHWGVAVYDAGTGEPVLRHNPHRLFTAASTMKLVTAAAALDLLGVDYRFETAVEWVMDAAGRADSLVVRGGGDPSMGDAFHDHPLAPLDALADSLAARGLRRVAGPLVIDQGRFDSTLVHPAWEVFDLDWYYAAPVAPFAVMGGAYEIVVTPGAVGDRATVTLPFAEGLVGVDAGIATVPGTDRWDDALRRVTDADSVVLRGTIGAGAGPDTSWIAQTEPGRLAGRAFRRALTRAGVTVDGPVVVRYGGGRDPAAAPATRAAPAADQAGNGATPLRVVRRSPPLSAIIRLILERSDNWATEQLLKTLAASLLGHGSWGDGTELAERYLVERVGVEPGAVYMRDGSGLTPQGLLSPDAVVALLRHARERPWGPAFRAALAGPGEPESTLDDRLLPYADRLAAKTGTLRHVNALSGYLRSRDGRELVFSILSNGSGRPAREVQAAVDRLVASIIERGS